MKEESLHAYVGNQWTKYLLTAFHVYVSYNGVKSCMNVSTYLVMYNPGFLEVVVISEGMRDRTNVRTPDQTNKS